MKVPYFDAYNLTINVTGNPEPSIKWFKKDETEKSFKLLKASNKSILTISSFFSNKTVYKAIVSNNIGTVEKLFEVSGYLNAPPKISIPDITKVSVQSGEDVEFLCVPEIWDDSMELQWGYLDNDNVKERPFGVITIKNATEENSGDYECFLKNDYGEDNLKFELDVLSPPKIEEILLNDVETVEEILVKEEDEELSLVCHTKGNPTPAVKWLKNGSPILDMGDRL